MKIVELYNSVLGVLYYIKKQKKNEFVSLTQVVNLFDQEFTDQEIIDIAKYLEASGHIVAEYVIGDVFAKITPGGMAKYETQEKFPDFDEFVRQWVRDRNIIEIAKTISDETLSQARNPYIEIVNEMINIFENNKSLKNSDGEKDVRILKLELEKNRPQKEVLLLKLDELSNYQGIDEASRRLRNYIYHYIGFDKY